MKWLFAPDRKDWRDAAGWRRFTLLMGVLGCLGLLVTVVDESAPVHIWGSLWLIFLVVAAYSWILANDIDRHGPPEHPLDVILKGATRWKVGLIALAALSPVATCVVHAPILEAERQSDLAASTDVRVVGTIYQDAFTDLPARWDAFRDGPVEAGRQDDHSFGIRISAVGTFTTHWPRGEATVPGSVRITVDASTRGEGMYGLFCFREFTEAEPGEGKNFFGLALFTDARYLIFARHPDRPAKILAAGRTEGLGDGPHVLMVECLQRHKGGPIVLALWVDGQLVTREWTPASWGRSGGAFGLLAESGSSDFSVSFRGLVVESVAPTKSAGRRW